MRWIAGAATAAVVFLAPHAAIAGAKAGTAVDRAQMCEERWLDNSGRFKKALPPDWQGLLAYWNEQAKECAGTVAYEARLALVFWYLDDFKKARATLRKVAHTKSAYESLVELTGLILDGGEATDHASLAALEPRLLDFVRRNPDFAEGLAFVGGVETTLGNHDVAIPMLEKAFRIAPPKMSRTGLYRNAAVSYTAVGRYKDAYDAAGAAISENKGAMADPDFMYAVIKTQAALGMFDQAETSARVLMAKEPRVKDDPDFRAVVEFVRERIKSTGK